MEQAHPWLSGIILPVVRLFIKTPIQGAQTTLYCSLDEKCANETGLYYAWVFLDISLSENESKYYIFQCGILYFSASAPSKKHTLGRNRTRKRNNYGKKVSNLSIYKIIIHFPTATVNYNCDHPLTFKILWFQFFFFGIIKIFVRKKQQVVEIFKMIEDTSAIWARLIMIFVLFCFFFWRMWTLGI